MTETEKTAEAWAEKQDPSKPHPEFERTYSLIWMCHKEGYIGGALEERERIFGLFKTKECAWLFCDSESLTNLDVCKWLESKLNEKKE